jgi:DNA repair protein RadC
MIEYPNFWTDLKSGRFGSMVKESAKGQTLSGPKEVYNVLKPLFAKEDDIEKMFIVFTNSQNQILGIENIFRGSINASQVYTREIVKRVIQLKSTAFIMVHNHPSGSTKPSRDDEIMTRKVMIAAESIDVTLHDHIIVGNGFHSMANSGWLNSTKTEILKYLKGGKNE